MKITRARVTYYDEEVPSTLLGFKGWEFSSGSTKGEDFKRFARLFRNHIKKVIPVGSKLVEFNVGHYYISGFVEKNSKFVYFSISDVRFFPEEWHDNILIRTAKYEKDYRGGSNGYTTLENFDREVRRLLR